MFEFKLVGVCVCGAERCLGCMFVCGCVWGCRGVEVFGVYVCMCVCGCVMFVCVCGVLCVCVWMCLCLCVYAFVWACVCVCMYVCVVCLCVSDMIIRKNRALQERLDRTGSKQQEEEICIMDA